MSKQEALQNIVEIAFKFQITMGEFEKLYVEKLTGNKDATDYDAIMKDQELKDEANRLSVHND